MKPLHADNNKTALLTPIHARPCSWMQLTLDFFRTMMHPQGYTHWNKNIQAVLLYVHTSHRSSFFGDEWDLIKSIQLKAPVQSIIVAKKQISNSIALEINQSITNCGKPRKKNTLFPLHTSSPSHEKMYATETGKALSKPRPFNKESRESRQQLRFLREISHHRTRFFAMITFLPFLGPFYAMIIDRTRLLLGW